MKRLAAMVPVISAAIFGLCVLAATATLGFPLRDFSAQVGVPQWLMIAIPGLLAMLFALIVYGRATTRMAVMSQSLSRALLVALLTWLAFSSLATVLWCLPERYAACLSNSLAVTGMVGGGPLLIASLVAGFIVGKIVLRVRR